MLLSGLPEEIADGEPLARFLASDGHFNQAMAKPPAFMPGREVAEVSVFRHGADDPEALWRLADRQMGADRRAKAVAIVTAAAVRQATLQVEADEPPPRHAHIVGWPGVANDPDTTRAKRKELALLLVQAATLICR